jgi:hypothetical protein
MSEDANTQALIETCLQLGQRVGELEEALLHMRGYIKLWGDDVAAGMKPTKASLAEASFLLAEIMKGEKT